jgi:hypothetical protein
MPQKCKNGIKDQLRFKYAAMPEEEKGTSQNFVKVHSAADRKAVRYSAGLQKVTR